MAVAIMVLNFTACSSDDDDNVNPTLPTGQLVTPTEDAVTVKVDGSYVVYGELEHGFDKALQRRLQGKLTSPVQADCFVFDVAALFQSSLSEDEWKEVVRRCSAGDASFLITQCTFKEFYNFAVLYSLSMMLLEQDNCQDDTDPAMVAESEARAKRFMANVVRNAYMAGLQADGIMTRGTVVNGQELDWENISQWPEEKQNTIMFDAYAYCGGNEIYVLNANAGKYVGEEAGKQPENDYGWGQKADAIADWLNRQRKKDDAGTRAGLADFARAITRGDGSTAISDLMSAQTKEFVFDYQYPNVTDPSVATAYSAIKVQYAVYSAYDFGGDVEYYQVRQNITVMNDKIFCSPGFQTGWYDEGSQVAVLASGAWMKRIDTKMWLEGSGKKSTVSAAPLNENGSSSGSTSTGGSYSTTTGSTDGYSVGASVGKTGLTVSANYTHTWTYSTSEGTTWNTSTNWSTKDLTTVFTQGNDDNATVTWTHTGFTPTKEHDTDAENVKVLLKSTCCTDEQTLWKVEKPSGIYTLKANFNVVSEIAKIFIPQGTTIDPDLSFDTQDNSHDISFDLTAPNRFKCIWNNLVVDYGTPMEGMTMADQINYIDDFLSRNYGNNSAYYCWAGAFISTEATADGSENARAVFQTFKNSIVGMKQQLRAAHCGGRIVFGLKPDGKEELTDSLAIDINN